MEEDGRGFEELLEELEPLYVEEEEGRVETGARATDGLRLLLDEEEAPPPYTVELAGLEEVVVLRCPAGT